jgi:hypothetical protein
MMRSFTIYTPRHCSGYQINEDEMGGYMACMGVEGNAVYFYGWEI